MMLVIAAIVLCLLLVGYFMMAKTPLAFGDGKRPVKLKLPVVAKEKISHDTIRIKLGIPSTHALGLPCGKHLSLSASIGGRLESRAYTPTSDGMRTKGHVELVIKVYKPCERFPKGGVMSQHVDELKVGDSINVRGPFGKIHYTGKGVFDLRGKRVETKAIGMIAGGTGITPMLQIINEILQDPEDMTELYLLFANKSEDDILVREELEDAQKRAKAAGKRFNLWYTLDKAPEGWKYSEGFVDEKMIAEQMPSPGDNPVMLFCGPPPMLKYAVEPNINSLKYAEDRFLQF